MADRFENLKSTTRIHPTLSIGTLTADVMDQKAAVKILEENHIEMLHVDVMDGQIWPKITVGHFFVAGLKTSLLKDIHLLTAEPENQIDLFVKAGADMISFSIESCSDIVAAIKTLKCSAEQAGRSVKCGLSVYANTSLETIQPYMDGVDYVTLVSIGPETGKENFLHEIPSRVAQLRSWNKDLLLCVDGAVKKNNIGDVAAMGADVIVTGSAVFDGNDAAQNIKEMQQHIATTLL